MPTTLPEEMNEKMTDSTSPLKLLADSLERIQQTMSRNHRGIAVQGTTSLMGILAVASAALYAVGYMPVTPAAALVLVGWVSVIRLGGSTSRVYASGSSHLKAVAVRTLDAALLLGVGLVFILREGWQQDVMIWAVAGGLTGYLSYYSQVAIFKAVPGGLRTGEPETMTAVDHLFLSGPPLWGPDRELVLGLIAVGLFIGRPEWGLAAAVIAGNLNWLLKFGKLWRKVNPE